MADHLVVDSSVLVAAHVVEHPHRMLAAPRTAAATHVLGQVLAEAWSVLRRRYRLSADQVADSLLDYRDRRELVVAPAVAFDVVLRTGRAQQLAGNVHDALIVRTAEAHDLGLVTIDQGMHVLANGIVDVELLRLDEP